MAEATTDPDKARFAVKTALSLTLAYMLPMALGWPQPQTAATTVMLIAATGMHQIPCKRVFCVFLGP